MISLLPSYQCNVQYAAETTLPLHKGINLHGSAKSRCEYVIKHLKDVSVGASYLIQITEVFHGTG